MARQLQAELVHWLQIFHENIYTFEILFIDKPIYIFTSWKK